MAKSKNTIQFLLNEYLDKHGEIDIMLPDGVKIEIGTTQETKRGIQKQPNYCWVATKRDGRTTMMDKYTLFVTFNEELNSVVNDADRGLVTII